MAEGKGKIIHDEETQNWRKDEKYFGSVNRRAKYKDTGKLPSECCPTCRSVSFV